MTFQVHKQKVNERIKIQIRQALQMRRRRKKNETKTIQ